MTLGRDQNSCNIPLLLNLARMTPSAPLHVTPPTQVGAQSSVPPCIPLFRGDDGIHSSNIYYLLHCPERSGLCSSAARDFLDRFTRGIFQSNTEYSNTEYNENIFEFTGLCTSDIAFILRILGEGPVTGEVCLTDGVIARIRNTRMARAWEILFLAPDGEILEHFLQIDDLPTILHQAARATPLEFSSADPRKTPAFNAFLQKVRLKAWDFENEGRVRTEPSEVPLFDGRHQEERDCADLLEALEPGAIQLHVRCDEAFERQLAGLAPVENKAESVETDAVPPLAARGSWRILSTQTRNVWFLQRRDGDESLVEHRLFIGNLSLALFCPEKSGEVATNVSGQMAMR